MDFRGFWPSEPSKWRESPRSTLWTELPTGRPLGCISNLTCLQHYCSMRALEKTCLNSHLLNDLCLPNQVCTTAARQSSLSRRRRFRHGRKVPRTRLARVLHRTAPCQARLAQNIKEALPPRQRPAVSHYFAGRGRTFCWLTVAHVGGTT